jgi:uncharacterized protein YfbU (UPF0304 family)
VLWSVLRRYKFNNFIFQRNGLNSFLKKVKGISLRIRAKNLLYYFSEKNCVYLVQIFLFYIICEISSDNIHHWQVSHFSLFFEFIKSVSPIYLAVIQKARFFWNKNSFYFTFVQQVHKQETTCVPLAKFSGLISTPIILDAPLSRTPSNI